MFLLFAPFLFGFRDSGVFTQSQLFYVAFQSKFIRLCTILMDSKTRKQKQYNFRVQHFYDSKISAQYKGDQLKLKIKSLRKVTDMETQGQDQNIIQSNQPETIKKIEHYLFKWSKQIGKGNFSEVYLGINQKNQQPVAVKLIKNKALTSKTAQRLLNHEISVLKYLDHSNVIKCYDVFSSVNNCYIITELCEGGDLEKILKQKNFFKEGQIKKIVYDTFKGLQYLNENSIVHRDLKIANIFLKNNTYKIADFGFAIRAKSIFKDISVGSPIYMTPQALISNLYGPKTDVWSFGVMIYELLHGEAPLDKCKTQQQLKLTVLKKPSFRQGISKEMIELIQKCLEPDVTKRLSLQELKKLSIIRQVFEFFQGSANQKLTDTFHSTTTASSTRQNDFSRNFKYDQIVAILHYCRLIHKISLLANVKKYSQWLLTIFQGLVKCKVTDTNTEERWKFQAISSSSPKGQSDNLKTVINQYYAKYNRQHNFMNEQLCNTTTFDDVIKESSKLYAQNQKNPNNQVIKNWNFMIYKQTQLLQKGIRNSKMEFFVKHSQAKQYLENQIFKTSQTKVFH